MIFGLQYCLRSQSAPNYYDPMTVNYFLGRLEVISSDAYVPSVEDVLRMRVQVITIVWLDGRYQRVEPCCWGFKVERNRQLIRFLLKI